MERRHNNTHLLKFILLGFAVILLVGGLIALFTLNWQKWYGAPTQDEDTSKDVESEEIKKDDKEEKSKKPTYKEVDFQSVVDSWVQSVSGNRSVYIYDLNLDKLAGSYNVSEDYGTASLYKLFVVYEGYKRVQNGEWVGETMAGSTGYTISKCLDLAIRESYSPCAETLWSMIGRDTLDTIIETEWKITDSDISSLVSNVVDINKIMQRFYEHPDFNDETLLSNMWDSFLNQPETTYEWRQGLPSGFSKAAVYDKVGWEYNAVGKYWNIYHDAAIVKFPLEDDTTRDFVVVVMTNKIDYSDIARFGTELENHFYSLF